MKGRFGHLEFDEGRDGRREAASKRTGAPSPTAEGYLQHAREEYRWGRFEPALRLYTRCLEESRAQIPAWVGQVQMLVELGEYAEARLWSDKALELFRNNGELLAAKAHACIRGGDAPAARACVDASIETTGSSPYRWRVRGEVLLATRAKNSQACFTRSLAESDADWFDRVLIARVYLYYRKAAAALEYASQAVQMQPTQGYAWYVLGLCQRRMGMRPLAMTSLGHCLKLRNDYAEAKNAMAELSQEPWWRRLFFRQD